MGLIKSFLDIIKEEPKVEKKFERPVHEKIQLKHHSEKQIKNPRKHSNYYKVKELIMRLVLINEESVLPCREIERLIGVGKSSVNRYLNLLVREGVLDKLVMSSNGRNVYYRINVTKEEAINYRNMFTPSGRKKKVKV